MVVRLVSYGLYRNGETTLTRSALLGVVMMVRIPTAPRADQIDNTCQMPWWNIEWDTVLLGPIAQSFVATAD
jgi:hypothetical protein